MRSLTLCLIIFASLCCDITSFTTWDQAFPRCRTNVVYEGMEIRHFILGGTAAAYCYDPLLTEHPYLTIDGKNVTKPVIVTNKNYSMVRYQTNLTRSTEFGEYRLHGGKKSVLLFRIGYILCDPLQIAPEKVCGKGQFCVINGSGTRCQKQLDCESINGPVVECQHGKVLRKRNSSCSGYNNAKNKPRDYYLGYPLNGTGCELEPRIFYKRRIVQYLSTILVSSSRDVESNAWNPTSRKMECHIGSEHETGPAGRFYLNWYNRIAWPKSLPTKTCIKCRVVGRKAAGTTGFFLFFYDKSVRFSIVQKETNTKIDVTNITKSEISLDASHPCYCNVMVSGGLFVKALRAEENSPKKPQLGEDSVKLECKKEQSTPYACWAFVYFYEQMADQGFKELYRENREIVIRLKATSSQVPEAVKIAVYVGIVLLTIFVITSMVFIVRMNCENTTEDARSDKLSRQPVKRAKGIDDSSLSSMRAIRSEDVDTMRPKSRGHTIRRGRHHRTRIQTPLTRRDPKLRPGRHHRTRIQTPLTRRDPKP